MNWRNASTETYNFQSATLSVALGAIPTRLFKKITSKKLHRLTYGPFNRNYNFYDAPFSLTAEYEFNTLTLCMLYPEPIKLPASCTALEVASFFSGRSFHRILQLCNMNPQILTLSFREPILEINTGIFQEIRNLYMIGCRHAGFFPLVTNLHIELCSDSSFAHFDRYSFPCLRFIYLHVPVVAYMHSWPFLSPVISLFVSIELTDEWPVIIDDCVPRPHHASVWFRWGHAKENTWSAYCKYDEIPKSVLQCKCLSL